MKLFLSAALLKTKSDLKNYVRIS